MSSPVDIALALISRPDFEGLRLKLYQCPAGYWTIGIGNRYMPAGKPVTKDTPPINAATASAWARNTLAQMWAKATPYIKVPLTTGQRGALLSFIYNEGVTAFADSTMLKCINSGRLTQASNEFAKWDKEHVNGVLTTSAGLAHRRSVEAQVFRGEYMPPGLTSTGPAMA